jgi:long-chain acyl-CoA synthetase
MLVLLEEHPSEVASALADRLAVTRPTITALVDGLVAKALVDRRSDPSDRRRVLHAITDAGRKALRDADAALVERLSQLTEAGPREAAESAVRGLTDWKEVLDELTRELRRREEGST